MPKLSIEIPEKLFTKLPKDQKSLAKVFEIGLRNLPSPKIVKKGESIVDATYGIEAINNHELIQEVLEVN